MRKIKLGVYFDTHFEPKGNKGDEIKERLNRMLRNSVEDIDQVVRYEITSSQRDYHNDGGSIITELMAYIEDGVNLYESDYRCVSEGDVDVINNRLWHRIAERKSDSMKNDWNLREVETYDIEHVSTSVDKEKQIDVDMDDRQSYVKNSNRSPDFKQMRTLYNHEFEQAFESIMDQLRERLKLTDENYRLVKSMVEKEPTEWQCERCGKQEVELHHELVRSAVRDHFRERLSDLDGFLINEVTGEVYMESTTVTRHISELVHNPDLLTPLCNECHHRRH